MRAKLLAVDLGAESGRVVMGTLAQDKMGVREVHRFPNGPVRVHDHLYWDILRLFDEVKAGIRKAAGQGARGRGAGIAGVGIDSWAVDFGLVGRSGELLGGVHHYRDPRTNGVMERVFERVAPEEIYRLTGVQFLPFNTIFQLTALKALEPELLAAADSLLMVGELLTYFLTGERVAEFTNATTTQLFELAAMTWSKRLFEALDLPMELMPPVIQPGTRVGSLLPSVASETGAGPLPVVAPAVHDTGSAVAAVPAEGGDWAFISSGTWSLVGLELPRALTSGESLASNISNEGGVAGTYRFLKNVMGLWLLQECRRAWAREGTCEDYAGLAQLAAGSEAFRAFVDPDDPRFFQPGDMPGSIRDFLKETGQADLRTRGEVVRCILESLALKYRLVLEQLIRASGRRVEAIHVVGGGARNDLLNQMTANATGRVVLAGPYEATAIGNLIVQGVGLGLIEDMAAARALVRRSFGLKEFQPQETDVWEEAYERFRQVAAREPDT